MEEGKKVIRGTNEVYSRQWIVDQMYQILARGKQGLDTVMKEIGRMIGRGKGRRGGSMSQGRITIRGDRGDTHTASAEDTWITEEDTAFNQSNKEHVLGGEGCRGEY